MTRIKKQGLWILVIFAILGVFGREVWQIVIIKITIDAAAQKIGRYIATIQYDPEIFQTSDVQHRTLFILRNDENEKRFISPKFLNSLITNEQLNSDGQIKRALIEAARYYSAINLVDVLKNDFPQPDNLKVVICSDRDGYSYNESDDQCYPFGDAGEFGGISIVSLSYAYKIGSSLGLDIGTYNFHVLRENEIECLGLGCVNTLVVELSGKISERYSITVVDLSEDGEARQIECDERISSLGQFDDSSYCVVSGATFLGFTPDKFAITVKWDGGTYSKTVEPTYDTYGKSRCSNGCKTARISVILP